MDGFAARGHGQHAPSADAQALYRQIASDQQKQPPSAALDELLDAGLIIATDTPDIYRSMPVCASVSRWQSHLVAEMRSMADLYMRLPEIARDMAAGYESQEPNLVQGAIEHLVDKATVNARIGEYLPSVTTEILTAQPGPRSLESIRMSYARDIDTIRSGISMRTLYRDPVRADAHVEQWARDVTVAGAQVRTVSYEFHRMIILDRRRAIVANPRGPRGAALVIHDEHLTAALAAIFDRHFDRARPFPDIAEPDAPGTRLTDVHWAVLRHLDTGATQARIAELAGLSERTVTATISSLKDIAGVSSTFQLGRFYADLLRSGAHQSTDQAS